MEGYVLFFKVVLFSEQEIHHLQALKKMCERYHVTFHNQKENACNVRLDDESIMKFTCDENGICVFSPGENKKPRTWKINKSSKL